MNKTTISLQHPTPTWAKYIVRTLLWITGIYAMLTLSGFDLTDFGVNDHIDGLITKYMVIATSLSSVIARFIGVEPVKLD